MAIGFYGTNMSLFLVALYIFVGSCTKNCEVGVAAAIIAIFTGIICGLAINWFICLYVLCGHLLGKGWPLGSRLWCLLWVCHFPIGILGQVWYLIVSIPDLCTITYFYSTVDPLHDRLWFVMIDITFVFIYIAWSYRIILAHQIRFSTGFTHSHIPVPTR